MKRQIQMACRIITGVAIIVFIAGCNTAPKRDPDFAATLPPALPQPSQASGSIYQAGYDIRLFEDAKARRVGDLLTVKLVERTQSSKNAATTVDRSQETTIANPTIAGTSPLYALPGALPLVATKNLNLETKLSSETAFDGSGDSSQSNSLNGDVTVTVAQVLPNGNLIVSGEKRLNLNQGNEYVKISGIVRPYDITPENTVRSTQIADATIIYSGDGMIADANKMGWLSRFFVSPLFPF